MDWRPGEKPQKVCSYYTYYDSDGIDFQSLVEEARLGEEYTKKYIVGPHYFDLSEDFPQGFGYGLVYYDTGLGSRVPVDVTKAA
jgi:hypothetical protein